jgi:hypothetical protein
MHTAHSDRSPASKLGGALYVARLTSLANAVALVMIGYLAGRGRPGAARIATRVWRLTAITVTGTSKAVSSLAC